MTEELAKAIQKREERLINYNGPDKVISSLEMKRLLQERRKTEVKFMSGYRNLDKLIDGFEGGEMIVISGPTKHGKSLFCQCLTENFYSEGIKSLWFSYELLPEQFLRKQPGNCVFYLPEIITSNALLWIDDRILEAKLKYDVRAVFLDHLHFLIDMEKLQNPSIEIGAIVRRLKRIAIEHNIVLFLVSHITKIPVGTDPTEANLRDSGMTACEADSTIMLTRRYDKEKKEYLNETKVTVCNHRRTGVMAKAIRLFFDKNMLWEDLPPTNPLELHKKVDAFEKEIGYDDLPF